MKTVRNLALVLICSLPLMACAYFDDDAPDVKAAAPAEKIDLTQKAPEQGARGTVGPVTMATPVATVPAPKLADLINTQTKGSVEYYSLDGNAPAPISTPAPTLAAAPANPSVDTNVSSFDSLPPHGQDATPVDKMPLVPANATGPVASHDLSVEVYPLDDAMRRALPGAIVAEPYAPPSAAPGGKHVENGGDVIYFDHDSAALGADDLRLLSEMMGRSPAHGVISVEGFASQESSVKDPVRRKIANLKMSMERALSVSRFLMEKGIPAEQITTIALGETKLGATAAESRRVEIYGF